MANPRVTIESHLQKIQQGDLDTVKKQIQKLSKEMKAISIGKGKNKVLESIDDINAAFKRGERGLASYSLRLKISKGQINSTKEAWKAFKLVIRDSTSRLGLMNIVLNNLISRFSQMLILFAVVTAVRKMNQAFAESELVIDSATRKIESLIISSSNDMPRSMKIITRTMIDFALKTGTAIDQLSDTFFFLASAGLKSAEAVQAFPAVQNLVIATSKDLGATMTENKQIVETFAAIMKVFGKELTETQSRQDAYNQVAAETFAAFQTNQIILPELAAGFSFAGAQAKLMGISFRETTALLATLNTNMIKGSKAGTSLSNALADLVKSPAEAKALFGIDVEKIGEGFSFLEDVLKPVNEALQTQGKSFRFLADLTQIWNKRGLKAVATLAPQYEEIVALMERMENGHKALNNAVEIVNASFKAQQGRAKNLGIVTASFFQRVILGGNSYRTILTAINDQYQAMLPTLFKIGASVTPIFFALAVIIDAILSALVAVVVATDDVIKGFIQLSQGQIFEGFNNIKKGAEEGGVVIKDMGIRTVDAFKGMTKVWDELNGTMNDFEEVIDRLADPVEKFINLMAKFEDRSQGIINVQKALQAGLKGTTKVLDDQGNLLTDVMRGITRATDALRSASTEATFGIKGLVEFGVGAGGGAAGVGDNPFARDIRLAEERAIALFKKLESGKFPEIEALNLLFDDLAVEGGVAAIIGGFTVYDKTIQEQIKDTIEITRSALQQLGVQWDAAWAEAINNPDAAFTIGQASETTQRQANNIIAELVRNLSKLRTVEAKKGFDSIIGNAKQLSQALKDVSVQTFTAGESIEEFLDNLARTTDPNVPDFQIRIPEADVAKLLGETFQFAQEAAEKVKIRLNLEIDKKGIRNVTFGEDFKRLALSDFDSNFNEIRKQVIFAYGKLGQKAFQQYSEAVRGTDAGRRLGDDLIKSLFTVGPRLESEQKAIDKFMDTLNDVEEANLTQLQGNFSDLLQEFDRVIQFLESTGNAELLSYFKLIRDGFAGTKKEIESSTAVMKIRLNSIADVFDNAAFAFDSFADIIELRGDDIVAKTTRAFSAILKSGAAFVDQFLTMQRRLLELEKAGQGGLSVLSQAAFGLGIVGIAASLVATIAGLGKEQKQNELDPEFLPTDTSARISPDYGQARVINQRISLVVPIQLLHPGQLTDRQQREIAEAIFDELQDIENRSG